MPTNKHVCKTKGTSNCEPCMEWRVKLWDAIGKYVVACGGDPSKHAYGNIPRMNAVSEVEELFREQRREAETPSGVQRSVDEILVGDAKTWATLSPGDIRVEHELLRRALENARAQIALWSPIVAWRHRCPNCQAGLICSGCENPWGRKSNE